MDEPQALFGLLDRLAAVRRADASAVRHAPRAVSGYESARIRLDAAAAQRVARTRAGSGLQGSPSQTRASLVEARIRRTFVLLNEYREALESKADLHWLGILLHAVNQDAARTFDEAAQLRPESPEFSAERVRCFADLEQLLRTLRGPHPPSDYELAHAMDALIVQLVRAQAAQ